MAVIAIKGKRGGSLAAERILQRLVIHIELYQLSKAVQLTCAVAAQREGYTNSRMWGQK